MKKFFKFLLLLILFLVFLTVLSGLGYWVVFVRGWPWWIFAVIAASIIGIIIGIFAIKRFLVRRNEKKFIQRVIKEEEAVIENAPEEEKHKLKSMQTQWKQSIDKLRKSLLRKKGNPLYVLPWYMLMGESGTGKTSAIKNSNLSSPLTDVSQAATISGTKNCDWWFFDQAIILDTAGRYTIPIDESSDKKEWQVFLTLLAKYRKKEPINGVIVGVSSATLLNEDEISLSEKARNIRQRINQLMRILGARFPVYLLVTKMDLVNGFTDFCDHIPDQRENQVMGYSNEKEESDCIQVLENCLSSVFTQLKKLRRIFIQNRVNNFAVVFPTEFMRLKPGLTAYVSSLFGEDIYQAAPLFRGIYFSSACRQGVPESRFIKETGIEYTGHDKSDRNRGYFLKNLFKSVLPGDRNIFTPVSEFIIWRKMTISLGIFSLILICSALCGILTFSYYNNIKAIQSYDSKVFIEKPVFSDITDNILRFDRQRFELEKLEKNNAGWLLPRLGLDQSLDLEKKLKRIYVKNVRDNLVKPLDSLFFEKSSRINLRSPYQDVVDYAVYDIRRINIFKNFGSDGFMSNEDKFEQSIKNVFPKLDQTILPSIASKFANIYYDYLKWDNNQERRLGQLKKFQDKLAQIADKSGGFHWLVSKAVCNTPDLTISDFFHGYDISKRASQLRVNGAFTEAGRNEIVKFVKLIKKAFANDKKFTRLEVQFWSWYSKEFYNTWYAFAVGFPGGMDWQSVTDNWIDAGALMATENNPYFTLLDYMADQFNAFKRDTEKKPAWVRTVIRIKHIKDLAQTEKEKEKGSLLAKLTLKKDKISKQLLGNKGTEVYQTLDRKNAADIDYDIKLAKQWNKYVDALRNLAPATSYKEKCYHMFSDFFSVVDDPTKQDKPFNVVYDDLIDLRTFFQQNGDSPKIFQLIKGPFDFFKMYGIYNTVHYLQNKWAEVILSAANSVDPDKYYSIMFDRNTGLIWKYVNDYASPFIDQNRTGFFAKKVFGMQLPFTNQFFRLLNKGKSLSLEQQKEYVVTIGNLPISINKASRIRPYSSKLTLECADEKTELVNDNFPDSKTFKWNPATCGDVTLSIKFKDITLKKNYKGKMGFAEFLSDFRDGRKIFNVSDFPDKIGYLTNNGVSDIIVSYQINGIEPVLKFWNKNTPAMPGIIFKTIKQKTGQYPVPQNKFMFSEKKKKISPRLEKLIKLNKKFKITMQTIPMGINKSADIKPLASIFWMNCSGKIIRFENDNYPDSVNFKWDPLACGKVVLVIRFPKITLFKKYQNFLEFVEDFHYHSRTFTCDDFPMQKEKLLQNNISFIKLTYLFKGDIPFFKVSTKGHKFFKVSTKKHEADLDLQPSGFVHKQNIKKSSDFKFSHVNDTKNHVLNNHSAKKKSAENNQSLPAEANPESTSLDQVLQKDIGNKSWKSNESVVQNKSLIKSKAWILEQNPAYYAIQIMMGRNKKKIIGFARGNKLQNNVAIYRSYIKNKEMYNLIYGCYESYNMAKKALTGLPDNALKYSPFIRRFASVIKEIR